MSKLPPMLSRRLVEGRSRRVAPPAAKPGPARRAPIAANRGAHPAPQDQAPRRVFEVEAWTDRLGGLAQRYRNQLVRLGNLETRLFAAEIAERSVDRPIYIAGLARAGTTILLEALERHPDTATHRYRDFPLVLTPLLWNRLLDRLPRRPAAPTERAHRDGIRVTAESPEAFEEVLWMAFFPALHALPADDFLDARTANPEFERFYREHIQKLLWLRGGGRYLSKANYNVTRFEYLLRMFPDARIVIPVRDPVWHIASLMKQHRLFCAGQHEDPRALRHLQRAGHFEFGLDRRPVSAGDPRMALQIARLWRDGREVEAWARYWNHVYGFVLRRLMESQPLRDAALVVRSEDLCHQPHQTIDRILDHCRLPASAGFIDQLAAGFRAPTYYTPGFSAAELKLIADRTAETASLFGYLDISSRWRAAS